MVKKGDVMNIYARSVSRVRNVQSGLVRMLLLALVLPVLAPAQALSLPELREAVGRMVRLHVPDAQVAARLRRIRPTEQVPPNFAAEVEGWGAGSLTIRELEGLAQRTANLPPSRTVLTSVQGRHGQFEIRDGEPAVILEAVRMYAEEYSQSIPNFLCYRSTSFLADKTGLGNWNKRLMLKERLLHLEDGDHHEIVEVDGETVGRDVRVFHGGITVSGEFGNIIRRIFSEKTKARFFWIGEEPNSVPGAVDEPLVAIAFEVDQENTSMTLSSGRREVKSGYRGELTVTKFSGQIVRVRLALDESEGKFPIRSASWDIQYAPTLVEGIEGPELLLPVRAITEAYQRDGFMRNEATYTEYQKYTAESNIQFGGSFEDLSDEFDH
jgi:hypothetical protein